MDEPIHDQLGEIQLESFEGALIDEYEKVCKRRSTGLWLAVRGQVIRVLAFDWLSEVRWLEYWPLIGSQRSGD